MANTAKERRYDTGDTIVGEGEGGVGFFVIADGEARVERHGERRGNPGGGRLIRRGRAARRDRTAHRVRHRGVAAPRVRHHLMAVHTAARAAPGHLAEAGQDPRPAAP